MGQVFGQVFPLEVLSPRLRLGTRTIAGPEGSGRGGCVGLCVCVPISSTNAFITFKCTYCSSLVVAGREEQGGEAKSATKSPVFWGKLTLGVQLELRRPDSDLETMFRPCRCSKTCPFWMERSQVSVNVLSRVCIPPVKTYIYFFSFLFSALALNC